MPTQCPHVSPGNATKSRMNCAARTRRIIKLEIACCECAQPLYFRASFGAIAQLGERLHGMQEVDGSIPSGSTKYSSCKIQVVFKRSLSPSSRGLGHHPFTVRTGVRIPVGTPQILNALLLRL